MAVVDVDGGGGAWSSGLVITSESRVGDSKEGQAARI